MSISRSYNKYNKTYYVYDTQYVWSEEKQKKVCKRTCIGKWDSETNQVIPTGSEGRLGKKGIDFDDLVAASKATTTLEEEKKFNNTELSEMFGTVATNLKNINSLLSELATNFESISNHMGHNAADNPSPQ